MTQEEYIKWKSLKGHQAFIDALVDTIIFQRRFMYITPQLYNRFESLKRKYNIKNALDAYPFIENEAIIIYNKRNFR